MSTLALQPVAIHTGAILRKDRDHGETWLEHQERDDVL